MTTVDHPRPPRGARRGAAVASGRRFRLLAVAAVLAAAVAACGTDGADDAASGGDPTPTEGATAPLPTDPDADGDGLVSGVCAEGEPDCEDTIVSDDDGTAGGASGSCPVGDEDCTDESFGGQDVARPIPVSSAPLEGEDAVVGVTSGARPTQVLGAHLLADTTLQIGFGGNPCAIVESVEVVESPDQVRLLLLTGQDPSVDACIESYVEYRTNVELDEPLGDRTVLDLSG